MIWLAIILMALWFLGVATTYTLGGFIHILLVLSLAVLLIQFTMGQREA
ncbi:MAG TPA: lmo0937 family membrane protein [Bryobacteraceae bacterium]|nr:lmo0937 family membrane protein [Bryobacteraceae bacterium]